MTETIHPIYVIFGATGGIGTALCRRLARNGARLFIAGRSHDRLVSLAKEVDAQTLVFDATDGAQVSACVDQAMQYYGRIDGLVNCVGSLLLKPAHLTTDEEWDYAVATNLGTAFAAVRAGAAAMMQTGGDLVLVSSAAAQVGLVNHDAIAAVKAGVIGLTRSAAATYAGRNIRVNCVAPGLVRTALTEAICANDLMLKSSVAMHPLGRIGEPGDVAGAIAWLLDAEQGWITGQVLGIDGGLASVRPRSKVN